MWCREDSGTGPGGVLLLAGLLVLVFSQAARAAEWSVESWLSLKEEVSDNVWMIPDPPGGVWGTTVSPGLRGKGLTETGELTGTASMNFVRYSGRGETNVTDLFLDAAASHWGDRSALNLSGGYVRDLTLGSELRETGLV
ncbi:MAG: hypothetical protein HY760_07490, partial [Nitrospirae bacterium]|nr:hypothetical protein [Nitrospirota bacterium]